MLHDSSLCDLADALLAQPNLTRDLALIQFSSGKERQDFPRPLAPQPGTDRANTDSVRRQAAQVFITGKPRRSQRDAEFLRRLHERCSRSDVVRNLGSTLRSLPMSQ